MKRQLSFLLMVVAVLGLSGCGQEQPVETETDPELPNVLTLTPQAIRRVGIQTLTVTEQAASSELKTVAEVRADENRVYHINPPVSGRIVQDRVLLGDEVRQGQVVAMLQNVEVVKVNADYIHQLHQNEVEIRQAKTQLKLAQQNLMREKQLLDEGISPRKDFYQAQTDYALAQSELSGLQEHAIHIRSEAQALLGAYGTRLSSPHSEQINTNSLLVAPHAGVITQKNVVAGDMVSPDKTLYAMADLSQVWLDLTLYPKDIATVKLGQTVIFISDALPGKTFRGTIHYLQPLATEPSQTFVARVFLKNPGLVLKPGLLGQATIQTEDHTPKPFVPEAGVQKYGKEAFVFLDLGNGKFKKRTVTLGKQAIGGYFVQSGIKAGERIVGKGSFTLKADMLKSQFGEEE
jgi:cobalt-zinc-cadmium efflux system membrane fusion protein